MTQARPARNGPQIQFGSGFNQHSEHMALHTRNDSPDRSYEVHVDSKPQYLYSQRLTPVRIDSRTASRKSHDEETTACARQDDDEPE
jgi:hypothetical protein